MKIETKVKIARAITVISKLTLWLGLLIGSICTFQRSRKGAILA